MCANGRPKTGVYKFLDPCRTLGNRYETKEIGYKVLLYFTSLLNSFIAKFNFNITLKTLIHYNMKVEVFIQLIISI